MYALEFSKAITSDVQASQKIVFEFFERIQEPERIDGWIEILGEKLDRLYATLAENPYCRQIYLFKPPIEAHHEYRAAQVGWFTAFWWIDEQAQVCHIYRILDSKSDFTKAGEW